MPPRILCRDQPCFQGGDLRHRLGRAAGAERRSSGSSFGEITSTAQSINHAHGLFGIQSRAAPPQRHRFAPPLPRQIVTVQIIRDPGGMQRCFRRRVQGAGVE